MGAPAAAFAAIGIITELAGTAQAVSAYNSAGKAGVAAAQYNVKLNEINLNRELNVLSSELKSFSGKQKADIAASGVSVGSKSALFAMNQALSNFEKEALIARENTRFQNDLLLFEAKQQQKAFKAQGKARLLQGLTSAAGSAALFGAG